jgi:hypothetical protein
MQKWIYRVQWCIGLALVLLPSTVFAESWVLWELTKVTYLNSRLIDPPTRVSTKGIYESETACATAAFELTKRNFQWPKDVVGSYAEPKVGAGALRIVSDPGQSHSINYSAECWPPGVTPQ